MTVTSRAREQVRQRANFACEFCGISETDAGGELVIDHFQPIAKAGSDSLDNLLYCCPRCNLYKVDYWPATSNEPPLWNPRREPASHHFFELDDGTLHALTPIGSFTLQRLRLNRRPLVAHRLRKREEASTIRLLTRYRDLVRVLEPMLLQQARLTEEQRQLLEEQRMLLQLLLQNK